MTSATRTLPALVAALLLAGAPVLPGISGTSEPLLAQSTEPQALDPEVPLTRLSVDLWTQDDGLPQNMAGAIASTGDGYLWLGTEEGLVRFDGVSFRTYGRDDSPALSSPWVRALWPDPDGTLWIGTAGGGLVRYRDGTFTSYDEDHGLAHDHIRALFRDREGTLWIGTHGGGVSRLVDGRFETLDTDDGLSSDFVLGIGQDRAGAVWVGTLEGLNRIDGDEITVFLPEDGLASERVNAVVGTADGAVWAGTTDGGLSRFRDGEFTTLSRADGLTSDYVTSFYEDAAGTLWVGTNGGGLNRLREGRMSSLTTEEHLPGDLILSLAGDREGGLWMGVTGSGLVRLRQGVFTNLGRAEGLSADIALALLEDRVEGMWIGTAGGGVNRVRDGNVTSWSTEDGLGHDVVLSLAQDRDGDVWVGMAAGGLSRIRDGRVTTFGPEDGLVSSQVTSIAEDLEGRLWLGTSGQGLQSWRAGSGGGVLLTRDDGLPDDYVTALLHAADGTLWIGTQGGLARLEESRVTAVPLPVVAMQARHVTGLHEDSDGTLWVSTNQGVGRVREGRASFFGPSLGGFLGPVHAVVTDDSGYAWLSSNEGITRVATADLDAVERGELERLPHRTFGRPDGLRSQEANGGISPAGVRARDGSLWFPTMRGAVRVEPDEVGADRPTPRVVLEDLILPDTAFPAAGRVTLPPESRTFQIRFTAPTMTAPHEVGFRFMLAGFDDQWVDAEDRRVAYYTNVPPGNYRFRVATRRGDGPWSEAEATLELGLAPHVWETGWFRVLAVLLLLGVVGGAYRLRIRTLERREAGLLRLMEERERADEALRQSEERLRLALKAGRMGSWEWDLESKEIEMSRASRDAFGFEATTVSETLGDLRDRLAEEHFERIAELPGLLEAGERSVQLDFPVEVDGQTRHVELRGRVYSDAHGVPERMVGVVADVTELMTTQIELRKREEELRQSQKMEAVGRLAGGVAHDFNNLLTAISGRTGVLLDAVGESDAGEEMREDLVEIQKAARRAADLTQQLLTFSRRRVYQPVTVDLNALVRDLERMLRRLVREDVALGTDLAEDLGRVEADPGALEQVLVNLVVNAQDAMPDGGRIVIGTRNDGPNALMSVTDTGHGMDAETMAQAFDPFFTTKPIGKGTGLGLSTVYGIVKEAGGDVTVDSAPGEGTRFVIRLERVEDPDEPVPEPVRAELAEGGRESILLVEDDASVRSLTRKVLERKGYRVHDTEFPLEALRMVRDEGDRFDLLISDVVMPELSGRELAERVVALRPGVGVLLMSGYNEDEVLRRGVHESGMQFLQKPFEAVELMRLVRRVLDEGRVVV